VVAAEGYYSRRDNQSDFLIVAGVRRPPAATRSVDWRTQRSSDPSRDRHPIVLIIAMA
jgi:hypothetical protein